MGRDLDDPASHDGDRERIVALDPTDLRVYHRELVLFIDTKGQIRSATGAVANALGYGTGEQEGSHIAEHIHPDDLAQVLEVVEWARHTDPPFHQRLTARARHKDGHWIPFRAEVLSAEPPLRGVILRSRPLDEDDPEHVKSDERFTSLADIVPVGILASDARGFVVFSNEPASHLLGVDPDALHGRGWEECLSEEGATEVTSAVTRILAGSSRERAVVEIERSGEQRFLHLTLVRLGSATTPTGWLATFEDITERQRAAAHLLRQATHDALTGLPNRLLLEDRLEQAVARRARSGGSLAVLFLDLEEFKEVNDEHGHATGDAALVIVAERLAQNLREADTLVRLGGDEFVAVCEGLDGGEVRSLVDRLRAAVAEPLPIDGVRAALGISIGVASIDPGHDQDLGPDELLARADQAMYRDKQSRRPPGWRSEN